jgi:hypothetical protein
MVLVPVPAPVWSLYLDHKKQFSKKISKNLFFLHSNFSRKKFARMTLIPELHLDLRLSPRIFKKFKLPKFQWLGGR